MKRGTIYIPDHLTEVEKNFVVNLIKEEIDKNPIIYSDHILIDKFNGSIDIKIFKRGEIEKICKKLNQSAYQVCMGFMREQNRMNK